MFVQTEITPNPNSLKFIPGKAVSNNGSFEIILRYEFIKVKGNLKSPRFF